MRLLGVSETCDLGAMYQRLSAEGHEVRVAISHPLAQATMAGLVETRPSWEDQLDWVGTGENGGIIIFESVGYGSLQDDLRARGYRVVGGSAFGDQLENEPEFAQRLLAELGLCVAGSWIFPDAISALAWLEQHPGRYVLKRCGADHAASDTFVGISPEGRDVAVILQSALTDSASWMLMEVVEGIEMGVGAYFNGARFLRPACLDWEHKRFFPGDLGELTGEMGTVATFDRTDAFFERTLARMEPLLRAHGHVGYVNLNMIVNEAGMWPLEFTCRFGYPGFAVLTPLQRTPWGELLAGMASGELGRIKTQSGFSVGVVLTTPPFPYSREQVPERIGMPVILPDGVDRENFHFGEIGRDAAGALVTTGLYGWTMVVTGTGPNVAAAKAGAYRNSDGILIPNLRYRTDIGDCLIGGDMDILERLGVFTAQ